MELLGKVELELNKNSQNFKTAFSEIKNAAFFLAKFLNELKLFSTNYASKELLILNKP